MLLPLDPAGGRTGASELILKAAVIREESSGIVFKRSWADFELITRLAVQCDRTPVRRAKYELISVVCPQPRLPRLPFLRQEIGYTIPPATSKRPTSCLSTTVKHRKVDKSLIDRIPNLRKYSSMAFKIDSPQQTLNEDWMTVAFPLTLS